MILDKKLNAKTYNFCVLGLSPTLIRLPTSGVTESGRRKVNMGREYTLVGQVYRSVMKAFMIRRSGTRMNAASRNWRYMGWCALAMRRGQFKFCLKAAQELAWRVMTCVRR